LFCSEEQQIKLHRFYSQIRIYGQVQLLKASAGATREAEVGLGVEDEAAAKEGVCQTGSEGA